MTRLQLLALAENIPLTLKNNMRRVKKCLWPLPRCQVM